jgi:hypothetical protein
MLMQPAHDDHTVIIKTLDDITVAHKLTGFYKKSQTLKMLCQNLERGWCAGGYNLPQEKKRCCHAPQLPNAQSGAFYFAYWRPEGQSEPVISKEVLGNDSATKFGGVQTFLLGLSGFQKVAAYLMGNSTHTEDTNNPSRNQLERELNCVPFRNHWNRSFMDVL